MKAGIWENGQVIIPFVAPLEIISNTPVLGQDSLNLRRNIARRGKTQRWEISAGLMPSSNSADFLIHNVANNFTQVIDILMPQINLQNPSTVNTTVLVDTTTNPGVLSVLVKNISSGKTIQKGEFIQFSNHDKIYVVTETLTGSGSLKIFPELQKQVVSNTIVRHRNNDNVLFKAYYDTDTALGIKFVDGILSDPGTVRFIEAI